MPTRRNNDTIPSLDAFFESKASEARRRAAEHIGKQKEPNIPVLPKAFGENPFSWAAGIFGMSDEDRIKYFGASDPLTCIYTATSQYNDKGALVSGNKTFKRNPELYGFSKVPLDSAKVGDMIQLTQEGRPYHSTIMVGRDETGMPHVGYSRGPSTPTFIDENDIEKPTMVNDTILSAFYDVDHEVTPTAYRYNGSPQKRGEWFGEYTSKYGLNPLDFFPKMNVEDTKLIEQPDALRVEKPVIKSEGGSINRESAWDKLSLAEKAEMIGVAVKNGITTLPEIRAKYNEFAEGGSKEEEEEVNTNSYSVGNLVNALYQNNPKEKYLGEPEHHYDFTQSEEWANAHGYYPDARGHRDDRVKKSTHPSHPSRGVWDGDKFVLTDFGMQNPNYTLFGLTDGGQDPQAVLTYQGGIVLPEVTITPKENYFFNPYDNIELHYAKGGKIHIKPENRGKFTALKKRTGHSATWFKEHGTPAQKKMATFALNVRHWKHGLGGNLFE